VLRVITLVSTSRQVFTDTLAVVHVRAATFAQSLRRLTAT